MSLPVGAPPRSHAPPRPLPVASSLLAVLALLASAALFGLSVAAVLS